MPTLVDLKNTLREWFRGKVLVGSADINGLDLVVPGEVSDHGVKDTWLRLSIQTGEAAVTGIGSLHKRRTRVGRVFVECFGEIGVGDGLLSKIATEVEQIWRDAMVAEQSPHQHIYVGEPSSFERNEATRACQVVSVPFQSDIFS